MWGVVASAVASVIGAQEYERTRADATPVMLPYNQPEPKQAVTAKCPCCGSRQFVSHQSRRICAYCRSEQDGQAIQAETDDLLAFRSGLATQQAHMYYDRLSMLYGSSALRPELAVRITQLTGGKTDGD